METICFGTPLCCLPPKKRTLRELAPCEKLSKTIEKLHCLLTLVDDLCRCLPWAQSVEDSLTLFDELCRLLRCADFRDSQSRKGYRKDTRSGIANQAAWEWGSGIGNSRKWLQKGAKGLLDPESQGLSRVSCTFRNLFCTGAAPFCTSARGFSFAGSKRPFAPSPKHFGNFLFSTHSPKRLVCNSGMLRRSPFSSSGAS